MQHEKRELELVRPGQFLGKSPDRFFQKLRISRPRVDQVARVSEDHPRTIRVSVVSVQFGFAKWLRKPLHVILHEDLDCSASDSTTAFQSLRQSACNGHVRAKQR